MFGYLVILLILLVGIVFKSKYGNYATYNTRRKYVYIISIILILQSGLRNLSVGDDTYNYYIHFLSNSNLSWEQILDNFVEVYVNKEGKDAGYALLNKMFSVFISDYQFFLLFVAALFFTALGRFLLLFTKCIDDLIISYILYSVLFYSFFSITGIRQTLAVTLCLFSINSILNKNLIRFFICIAIAFLFHKSSLIFLPFYFISRLSNIKKFSIVALIMFPIMLFMRIPISNFFKQIGGFENYGEYEGAGTYIFSFFYVSLILLAIVNYNGLKKLNPYFNVILNAIIIGLLFLPMTYVNPSAMRIVQYFSIFILILMPDLIKYFKSRSKEFGHLAFTLVIVLFLLLYTKNQWKAKPYAFFWEETVLGENYQ